MGLSRLTTREVADRCMTMASALLPGAARAAMLLTDAAAGAQGGAAARAATAMLMPAHRHFCVDEDPEEAARVMNRLRELGIGGIIDYAAEAATSEAAAAKNARGVIRSAEARIPNRSAIVCKMSALAPPGLLEQHAAHLWAASRRGAPAAAGEPALLARASAPPNAAPLREVLGGIASEAEMAESVGRVERRLHSICEAAAANNLQVMLDAEEWAIQPAIDRLAFRAMARFNARRPVVHQTIQSYLADAHERLELFSAAALAAGVRPGVKVVRGAYMELEEARSGALGTPSPVCASIERTAEQYMACVDHALRRMVPRGGSLLVCTHNSSAARAVIADHGLQPPSRAGGDDWPPRVRFAQLKGMADSLSLELAERGFAVDKYVPYGEISQTLKFLARRALENSSASSAARREFAELAAELVGRIAVRPRPGAVPQAH